ncbi:optineurin isoform X1 [Carcharodon carcharias]|uniref:optineurin isoform X1 n=2 Tax=Carcharodon carcharias TaxID=13397 RepID=UPI001B7E6D5B|nr:optineurin isoform X1 [Carcharodon carcharias]XP_041059102.1 optineurin isoform X1 [Carcharodon carcharias]
MMCSNQLNTSSLGQTGQNLNQGLHAVNGTAMNVNGPHVLGTFTPEDTLQQMDELIKENNELKEAIKQTNHAMKERYEELATWREKQREEREYIQKKFEEAKARLTDFAAENETLKSKIQELNSDGLQGIPKDASSNLVEQDVQQLKALVSRLQTEKADLVAMNSELLLKLGAAASDDSFVEIRMVEDMDDGELKAAKDLQCEDADSHAAYMSKVHDDTGKRLMSEELTVSQLLHVLRDKTLNLEKLEHELQSSKQRISELEKASETTEVATQTEKNVAEQPSSNMTQELTSETPMTIVNVEQQNTETAAPVEGLSNLNKQSPNEVEALKSQVMSLVKDLQEAQKKLDEAENMKKSLHERGLDLEQKLANSQVVVEETRQLKFSNEKLKLQVESLQSEQQIDQMKLADEKMKLTEEKRKLTQIQAAYDNLFEDYNDLMRVKEEMKVEENKQTEKISALTVELDVAKRTMEENQKAVAELTRTIKQQTDELNAQSVHNADLTDISSQLEMAEKALAEKQQKIDTMKQTIIKQEEEIETVAVFQAQADVYSADFHAERAAREAIHAEKESLVEKLHLLVKENTKMKEELDALSRQSLIELQRRHSNLVAEDNVALQQPVAQGPESLIWEHQGVLPEHVCPKCGTVLPDIDTLQIHVMDCII